MLFPPYLIHSQSTSAVQETTRLGCQDLGFLNLPEVKAGYTKQMTNKGRHLAGGLGNLVSPRGNQRKQVSLPAPAQKMATTYILSQLFVTKEYKSIVLKSNGRACQGPHEPSWNRGISHSRIHTKLQLLHLAIQLQPHSEILTKTTTSTVKLNVHWISTWINQPFSFVLRWKVEAHLGILKIR